jgi:ribosomal protein S18 acetylase RimI-like enzyme
MAWIAITATCFSSESHAPTQRLALKGGFETTSNVSKGGTILHATTVAKVTLLILIAILLLMIRNVFAIDPQVWKTMYVRVENDRQVECLAHLAKEIWANHFGGTIAKDTLDVIIETAQSKEAIEKQMNDGLFYYLIPGKRSPVGYFAYRLSVPKGELFLSKLYILATERRKGLGRQVLQHLETICRDNALSNIQLTVYPKNTSAIESYKKLGFRTAGTIHRDLGNGIAFDDILMKKTI